MSAPTENQSDARAYLVMGTFSSRCGACGGSADPQEDTHDRMYGTDSVGCGVRWTHLSTDYVGFGALDNAARSARPDLPFVAADARASQTESGGAS